MYNELILYSLAQAHRQERLRDAEKDRLIQSVKSSKEYRQSQITYSIVSQGKTLLTKLKSIALVSGRDICADLRP
jgi:hypothetical protein